MNPTSTRTLIRDAVVSTLRGRQDTDAMRLPAFDVSLNYLTIEECKRFPTYCVIVTDEIPESFTLQQVECRATIVVVVYAKHESDVRAMLDKAIEDVYETMLTVQQGLEGTAWKCRLDALTTDEGTTIEKPHAQAVQRWTCHYGRAARAA